MLSKDIKDKIFKGLPANNENFFTGGTPKHAKETPIDNTNLSKCDSDIIFKNDTDNIIATDYQELSCIDFHKIISEELFSFITSTAIQFNLSEEQIQKIIIDILSKQTQKYFRIEVQND